MFDNLLLWIKSEWGGCLVIKGDIYSFLPEEGKLYIAGLLGSFNI